MIKIPAVCATCLSDRLMFVVYVRAHMCACSDFT